MTAPGQSPAKTGVNSSFPNRDLLIGSWRAQLRAGRQEWVRAVPQRAIGLPYGSPWRPGRCTRIDRTPHQKTTRPGWGLRTGRSNRRMGGKDADL